ncbi:MAG: helix-turn-helix domain-containing protein [Deltaproteobacteria bacterium]|nr:helix-turn-helix domain-containing protein [Deltaproteobacteria bacterium]
MAEQKAKVTISTNDLLSVPQAAKELGVHFATVYRWIDKGKVRPFRIGGQVFITADDLKALKEHKVEGPGSPL